MWTKVLARESEAGIWLKAHIVPLVTETMNEDGTTKVKLRSTALVETPNSIAVDQAADHLGDPDADTAGWVQAVGAEAMIGNRFKETFRIRMAELTALLCPES